MLVYAFSGHVLTQKTCERWFKRIESGDFYVKDMERPNQPKVLSCKFASNIGRRLNSTQAQRLAWSLNVAQSTTYKTSTHIRKGPREGREWSPYELKDRDIERRKTTCGILLPNRKEKVFCVEF